MRDLTKLNELAHAILDDTLKANAIALAKRMGEVLEGFDTPREWRPELLKLVQGTTDRSKLPRGATIGSLVLGEELLEQPLRVIPLLNFEARQYWDPNPDNAKMLCNSPDAKQGYSFGECRACPYSKFSDEDKPQCSKIINVLCVTADLTQVFNAVFAKTNYMNGKGWLGLMTKAGVSSFKRVYRMSSQTSTKSKNVELLSVVTDDQATNKVEGSVLAFVAELYALARVDRDEGVVKFYELAKNRKANAPALEAPTDTVLIEAKPDAPAEATLATTVTDVVDTSANDTGVRKAKYKM